MMVREGGLHGAGEDQELADEAVQHGQPDDGERDEDEHRGYPGKFLCKAAVLAHVVGAVALVEQAEQHEEGCASEALVQNLIDAAVQARNGEGEDAQSDEAELAQRGVGGELLQVVLHQRQQPAVDDANGR